MKSLEKIIQEKTDLIASSDDEFISSLSELLPDNANELKKYIADLDTSGGKLVSNVHNRQKLIEIRKFLIEILRKDYNINFNAYIKRFEDIAGLNVEIQAIQGIEINASEFGFAKKIMTDLVADQLSLDNVVDQTVRPGIQQILYKHVMGGYNRKDATTAIETFLKDKEYIKRWSKVVARDTIRNYDEAIQDQLLEQYDYDGYFYTGTLIETSRHLCEHWVYDLKGFVTFEEMAKTAERYPDKVEQKSKYTIKDFKELRYNCRHNATLGFMTERIKRNRLENKPKEQIIKEDEKSKEIIKKDTPKLKNFPEDIPEKIEYSTDLISKELDDAGYYTKISKSKTDFGKSNYIYVDNKVDENGFFLTPEGGMKIRISDHNVTSLSRIGNEHLININKDYDVNNATNSLNSVLKAARFKFDREKYFKKITTKAQEKNFKVQVPSKNALRDTDIITNEFVTKKGNTIYEVTRTYEYDVEQWVDENGVVYDTKRL